VALKLYRMKRGQEAEIAEIIHALIVDYGQDMWTELSPEWLLASEQDLHIEIAEEDTFSFNMARRSWDVHR
jgi:hypothetical protein